MPRDSAERAAEADADAAAATTFSEFGLREGLSANNADKSADGGIAAVAWAAIRADPATALGALGPHSADARLLEFTCHAAGARLFHSPSAESATAVRDAVRAALKSAAARSARPSLGAEMTAAATADASPPANAKGRKEEKKAPPPKGEEAKAADDDTDEERAAARLALAIKLRGLRSYLSKRAAARAAARDNGPWAAQCHLLLARCASIDSAAADPDSAKSDPELAESKGLEALAELSRASVLAARAECPVLLIQARSRRISRRVPPRVHATEHPSPQPARTPLRTGGSDAPLPLRIPRRLHRCRLGLRRIRAAISRSGRRDLAPAARAEARARHVEADAARHRRAAGAS